MLNFIVQLNPLLRRSALLSLGLTLSLFLAGLLSGCGSSSQNVLLLATTPQTAPNIQASPTPQAGQDPSANSITSPPVEATPSRQATTTTMSGSPSTTASLPQLNFNFGTVKGVKEVKPLPRREAFYLQHFNISPVSVRVFVADDEQAELINSLDTYLSGLGYKFRLPSQPTATSPVGYNDASFTAGYYHPQGLPDIYMGATSVTSLLAIDKSAFGVSEAEYNSYIAQFKGKKSYINIAMAVGLLDALKQAEDQLAPIIKNAPPLPIYQNARSTQNIAPNKPEAIMYTYFSSDDYNKIITNLDKAYQAKGWSISSSEEVEEGAYTIMATQANYKLTVGIASPTTKWREPNLANIRKNIKPGPGDSVIFNIIEELSP